eukprot:COSAG01_NODE_16140_length_1266_cov_2.374464_1_plen_297_part_01
MPFNSIDIPSRAELEAMRLPALQAKAAAVGVDDAALAAAEDSDSPKAAIVRLILAEGQAVAAAGRGRTQSRARWERSTQAIVASLRAELAPMRLSAVYKRAAAAGVDNQLIAEAEESESPKKALIELIITAELSGRSPTDPTVAQKQALRASLEGMRLAALQQRAVEVGVHEAKLEEAEDSERPKQALIELIVAAANFGGDGVPGGVAPSAEAAAAARREMEAKLGGLKLSQLRKRAVAVGIDDGALEAAMDDGKGAVIALICEASCTNGGPAAHARQLKQLQEELETLRLGALQRR